MKHIEIEQPDFKHSLWSADRFAYVSVLAGAAAYMGDGLFGLSRAAASESFIWYIIAVPMLALAAYTVISGINLRRKLDKLGDFGEVHRREKY